MTQVYYDGEIRDTLSAFDVRRAIRARDGVRLPPGKLSQHLFDRGSYFESLGGWVERAPAGFVLVKAEGATRTDEAAIHQPAAPA